MSISNAILKLLEEWIDTKKEIVNETGNDHYRLDYYDVRGVRAEPQTRIEIYDSLKGISP